jgi:GDP-L-fucose synthase
LKHKKIYIPGNTGLVGSAIVDEFVSQGYSNLLFSPYPEYDLTQQNVVEEFFIKHRPDFVIIAAAIVGGIKANSDFPYKFIYDNLMIEANLINASIKHEVKKLIFLGSSCIYPKEVLQPMKEEYLLSGYLEPTNEPYAIAKIAGIKLCQSANRQFNTNYISLMPSNLYGNRDNFDFNSSHVLPAMIRKFHEALPDKDVILWGTGSPMREFLHVTDLAKAVRFISESDTNAELINVGTGKDISIENLALLMKKVIGHSGRIVWDDTKPDGTMRKLLDTSRINTLGWTPSVELENGIRTTYQWFLDNVHNIRETTYE